MTRQRTQEQKDAHAARERERRAAKRAAAKAEPDPEKRAAIRIADYQARKAAKAAGTHEQIVRDGGTVGPIRDESGEAVGTVNTAAETTVTGLMGALEDLVNQAKTDRAPKPRTDSRGMLLDLVGATTDDGWTVRRPFRTFHVEQAPDGKSWRTRCTAHGTLTTAPGAADAEKLGATKARATWCDGCGAPQAVTV